MGKKRGSAKEKVAKEQSWGDAVTREFIRLGVAKDALLNQMLERKNDLSIQQWIEVWRHSPAYIQPKVLDVIEERGNELSLADRKRMMTICGRVPHLLDQKDRIRNLGLRSIQAA